jgi:membrane-associated phospholipid phosphatase
VISLPALAVSAARLRRLRYVLGTGLALLLVGYVSGAALELLKLFVERARPEEVLGGAVQLSHDRSWAALASFPSGHMIVTAALAVVAATVAPGCARGWSCTSDLSG